MKSSRPWHHRLPGVGRAAVLGGAALALQSAALAVTLDVGMIAEDTVVPLAPAPAATVQHLDDMSAGNMAAEGAGFLAPRGGHHVGHPDALGDQAPVATSQLLRCGLPMPSDASSGVDAGARQGSTAWFSATGLLAQATLDDAVVGDTVPAQGGSDLVLSLGAASGGSPTHAPRESADPGSSGLRKMVDWYADTGRAGRRSPAVSEAAPSPPAAWHTSLAAASIRLARRSVPD